MMFAPSDPWKSKNYLYASALLAAANVRPIEFQNQRVVPIRILAFSLVVGRSHPVSGSVGICPHCPSMKIAYGYNTHCTDTLLLL